MVCHRLGFGFGVVWVWFGLVWLRAGFVIPLRFPMDRLGLAWFGFVPALWLHCLPMVLLGLARVDIVLGLFWFCLCR